MKVSALVWSLLALLLSWAHAHPSEGLRESLRQDISQLLTSEQFGSISEIKINEIENGMLTVNLTVNIGDRWGKEIIAKELAKHVMEIFYQSKLPISQAAVKVFSNDTNLLVLALGANQARKIHWGAFRTGQDFVDYVKSNHSGIVNAKTVEDFVFVVEHQRISRPFPLLKVEE